MSADELAAPSSARPFELQAAGGRLSEAKRQQRLRRMVTTHFPTVWRFLRRLGLDEADADDALQEIALIAMRKLDAIVVGAELTFLLRTAYRVGSRQRSRRPQVGAEGLVDPVPHPDVLFDQKRARQLLDEILALMSVEQRTVFVLHDIEGLTMAEIASALEISSGTVASRLRSARRQFERRVARIEARMKDSEVPP